MNIYQYAYNFCISGLAVLAIPVIGCFVRTRPRRRSVLTQRLGYDLPDQPPRPSRGPKIWIHAVSVGEVRAAEAIVHALENLRPQVSILLTTTTATGQRYAIDQFGRRATVRYAPLDLWRAVGRFLATHQPDLLVCMETEIWPNWITRSHGAGVKTVFLNGRISARSIRSYTRIQPLIGPVLEKVERFSMISEPDARRIISLGAPAHRVRVNGNVKVDVRISNPDKTMIENLKRLFTLDRHTPVWIAGSVRGAEAEIVLEVYARLATQVPGMVVVVAPRHIQRSSHIADLARDRGIPWQFRTDLGQPGAGRQAPVVILDTIGELRNLYALATVVFCGASLVPMGGQNVLEAAVWAKPVLFGPSMEDFEEARRLLEGSGGGICVNNGAELADRVLHLLSHPGEARRLGRLARQAVLSNQGAALRHARVIDALLPVM
ncbi:MAG: 3-deoxy-D-manno-octulosonic acid transferase [Desulfosarcina sp.]